MTGPHESILGRRIDRVLAATLTGMPHAFDVATDDLRLNGAVVESHPENGPGPVDRASVDRRDGGGAAVPGTGRAFPRSA